MTSQSNRLKRIVLRGLGATGLALVAGFALAAVLYAEAATEATPAVQRLTGRRMNCTEDQCHAKQRDFKFLHGPTAVGACDACHTYVDEKKHTFQLKRAERELCGFCHVGKQIGKVIHKPITEGQCLGCHNPHGAANREMLRSADMGQLCASCHGDVTKGRKQMHGPVASGYCSSCHNSHASDYPKLLVSEGRALCLGCHKEMAQQLQHIKVIHKPVEGDCLQCHEAHASNYIMQLKQEPLPLCLSCHAQVKQAAQDAPYKHSAVIEGKACLGCHTSHGSDLARLMKGDTIKECLSCHDKPLEKPGGGVVQSVAELAKPDLFKHGPIRDGNCTGCHTLHGGPFPRLLVKPYTETFYQAFSVDAYALCFSCHDKQLVLAKETEGLTRFRNGSQNLHFLHVDKPQRGRSCYACHMIHASAHPAHIRDSVPYGNWEIPIAFKPTETGGSCAPGCHRETKYDRVNPVPPPVADKKERVPEAPGVKPASPSAPKGMPKAGPGGAWTSPPTSPPTPPPTSPPTSPPTPPPAPPPAPPSATNAPPAEPPKKEKNP
jgi:predicted CXXCH cytochrome family protein